MGVKGVFFYPSPAMRGGVGGGSYRANTRTKRFGSRPWLREVRL